MRLLAMTCALITGLLLTLAVVAPTQAQRILRIVFEGTHEAGGTVRFTVATEESKIVALELEGVAGGGCTWDTLTIDTWGGGPIPIVANLFEATNGDGDVFRGEVLDHGRVEGTVAVSDPVKGCSTSLRWTANVLPPGPQTP